MKKIFSWVQSHPYSYMMLYMLVYLAGFFLLEQVTVVKYWISCPLDDKIPFIEYFILPYLSWLILMPASLLFFLLYNKEDFQNLCLIMFGGMSICLILYAFFPNGLNLRTEIVRDNLCSRLAKLLYTIDTPTNVCPSIHVSSSLAIAAVAFRSQGLKKHPAAVTGIVLWMLLICVSTVFVKQHSVVDIFWGAVLTVVLYIPVYHFDWRKSFKGTFMQFFL